MKISKSYFFCCFVIISLFIFSTKLQAQSDSDSLKNLLKDEFDEHSRAEIFYDIAESYYYNTLDSALFYYKEYLESSKRSNDTAWVADAYNNIAYVYDEKGEIELALEYFQKALEKYIILKDSYFIAACYNNLGYMTSYGMDQAKGLSYFLEAIQIAEDIQDSGLISDVSTNIAYYYDRVDDNTTAFRYYKKALDFSVISDNIVHIALSYVNMAGINIKMKNFDAAKEQLMKAKQLLSHPHSDYQQVSLYTSIIDCYILWEKRDSAELYINKSEQIIDKNEFAVLKAYLLEQKGNLAFLKKEYHNCIKYLDESILLFTSCHTIEPFSRIYAKQAAAYSELKMNDQAYKTLQIANSLNDSLGYGILANMLGEFEQKRIHRIEMEKNNLEKELTDQKLENYEFELQSNFKITLFSILFLVSVIVIVFYFLWRIRKKNAALNKNNTLIRNQKDLVELNIKKLEKNEKELKELNATKDRFFSIIGHDLKNPFSSIVGLTELLIHKKDLKKSEKFVPMMETMNSAAKYGINLLDDLLKWARSQTGNIVPNPEKILYNKTLEKAVTDLNAIATEKSIKLDLKIDSPAEVLADENMITTVLRNLINNAIKFSFENSIVHISAFKKDNFLVTNIEDQGVGISKEDLSELFSFDSNVQKPGTNNEKGTGLGLLLCKEFVTKNNGEIWAEGELYKGCKFSFTLPLYNRKTE